MGSKNLSVLLLGAFILSLILISCNTSKNVLLSNGIQKRKYRPGYYVSIFPNNSKKEKVEQINKQASVDSNQRLKLPNKFYFKDLYIEDERLLVSNKQKLKTIENGSSYHQNTVIDTLRCDLIVLRNGEEIIAKVKEVGENNIKYRKCSNLSGPLYTKNKSELVLIRYADGSKDIFAQENSTKNQKEETIEAWSITSLITGVVGALFVLLGFAGSPLIGFIGLILAIPAFIFGMIGLSEVKRNPAKRGVGFAITGIILGGLMILFVIIAALASL